MTNTLPSSLQRLEDAASGLLVQSETDAPLEAFWWRGDECAAFLERVEHSGSVKVQCLDNFFAPLAETESWMSADEVAQCERFAALRDLLKAEYADSHVYSVDGDVFIFVAVANGAGGLKTKVVET